MSDAAVVVLSAAALVAGLADLAGVAVQAADVAGRRCFRHVATAAAVAADIGLRGQTLRLVREFQLNHLLQDVQPSAGKDVKNKVKRPPWGKM